jgi:hypothetical protein
VHALHSGVFASILFIIRLDRSAILVSEQIFLAALTITSCESERLGFYVVAHLDNQLCGDYHIRLKTGNVGQETMRTSTCLFFFFRTLFGSGKMFKEKKRSQLHLSPIMHQITNQYVSNADRVLLPSPTRRYFGNVSKVAEAVEK